MDCPMVIGILQKHVRSGQDRSQSVITAEKDHGHREHLEQRGASGMEPVRIIKMHGIEDVNQSQAWLETS